MHVCGIKCMYAENFWVHASNFGCMYAEQLGAKYAVVGCKVCGCWVHVCGDVWVHIIMPFGCISDTADSLPDSR